MGEIEGVYVKLQVIIRLVLHELPKMQLRYGVVVTPTILKNMNIAVVLLMNKPFRILPFFYFSDVLKLRSIKLKAAFFQKVRSVFKSPKNYSELTFKIPTHYSIMF